MDLRAPLSLAAALLTVGCSSREELRRVEREMGDLKVEVFKLRQQQEDAAKKAEAEQQASAAARAQDRRFQADLQENLRHIQDTVRVINNKVGSTPPRQPQQSSQPAATPHQAPASDEDKAFQVAMQDYNRGNYALATEGFQLFAKGFPASSRRPEALFHQGLCHYNEKEFPKAQSVFDLVLKEYAGTNYLLPSKLKRAQCLLKQNLKPAAAKAFKEIAEKFEGSPEARTAKQELADMGL